MQEYTFICSYSDLSLNGRALSRDVEPDSFIVVCSAFQEKLHPTCFGFILLASFGKATLEKIDS